MNITDYEEKKESGAIQVIKLRGGIALVQRQWNPGTGGEVEPLMTSVNMDELTKAKEAFQKQLDNVDLLIADVEALKDTEPI